MSKCLRLLAAAVLAYAAANAQAPSPQFVDLAQQAVSAQQSGDYARAAALYRQLLQLDPNQVATHVNLAITLVNLGRFDEAIAEYGAADRLLPGDTRIQKNLALAYEKSGRIDEARAILERLHNAAPGDSALTLLLADCALQAGDDASVVQLLQPLQITGDRSFDYMLGMALLHLQRPAEAQLYLDRILKEGDTAEARFLLATRMFQAGDYPHAAQQFAAALQLNPDLRAAQSFYGQALLQTGDPDGASAAFRRALAADPNDFAANLGLAQIAVARKRFSDALEPARRAASLRPKAGDANLALASALAGLQQYSEANAYAAASVNMLPGSPAAHRTMALVFAGLEQPAKAAAESKTADRLEANLAAEDGGPKLHQEAPAFTLPGSEASASVSLRDYRGKSPVVLVFGSYSCPNFRDSAVALKALHRRYGSRIPFLLIYIREAHANGTWQSTRNTRSGLQVAAASNLLEKEHDAAMCSRRLHLPFTAVVDGMDNAVETAYNAWPSRAFIIDSNGRIAYSTRLTELDFHPDEMEQVLRALSTPALEPVSSKR